MTLKLFGISSLPGVQRDGSLYANNRYIDSTWTRWQRHLPRKIGGYRQLITGLPNVIRGVYVEPNGPTNQVYIGDSASFKFLPIDLNGNVVGGLVDRTPAGFVANPNYQWKIETMYVAGSPNGNNYIFAHPASNLLDIDDQTNTNVFYGPSNASTPLVATGIATSGGIVAMAPYLVYYGNDGSWSFSFGNNPTQIQQAYNITAQKIVQGKQVRGGNSSPAGLFWSLDSVIRATFTGTADVPNFTFDTLTDESSILSSNSVIEYDNRYYWIGIDKFYVYNGVVQELPNDMNINFFFDNLNYQYKQKVWATKVPRYNEIWWFFPFGNSTECNRAIIYNLRLNCWYDASISRSSGYYAQVFQYPIWADCNTAPISLWQHEYGYDQVIGTTSQPIVSSFTTGDISWCAVDPSGQWNGTDRWVNFVSIEPDFRDLVGTMQLTVQTQQFAQDPNPIIYGPFNFTQTTGKDDLGGGGVQGRFMTLTFENNSLGGNYQLGQTLLYMGIGDARR